MYICVINNSGETVFHKNMECSRDNLELVTNTFGKTKSDKIDSEKIANMLRGGMFPIAYAYPKAKRAVRDLLRRRLFFVRQRAELSVHLQNTNHHTSLRAVCMRRNYLSRRSRGLRITEAYTARLLKNENYMRL